MDAHQRKLFLLQLIADDGFENNQLECAFELVSSSNCSLLTKKRKYEKERNKNFFEVTVPTYTNDQFREHFRMNRSTFEVCACTNVEKNITVR